MLDSSDPRKTTHLILQRLNSTATVAIAVSTVEEGVPPQGVSIVADSGRDGEDSDSDECL
jgi:hypothetical protein